MDGFGLRDDRLRAVYADTRGPVAFLDESYRAARSDSSERPFYTIAAVVVDREQAATIRSAFTDIHGSLFWHTTDFYKDQLGRQYIHEMLDYLASSDMFTVITVQSEIKVGDDKQMNFARAECLSVLSSELTRGGGENAVRLMVMDSRERKVPGGDKFDQDVVHRLRIGGLIDRAVRLEHSGPGIEPLLWAPDVAGWSYRRELAVSDNQWFNHIRETTVQLHAQGANVAVKRNNPHVPQHSPGALNVVPEVARQVVSRSSLVHQGSESEELAAIRRLGTSQRPSFANSLVRGVGAGGISGVESLQRQVKASPTSTGQQNAIKNLDAILGALKPPAKNSKSTSVRDTQPITRPDEVTRGRSRRAE